MSSSGNISQFSVDLGNGSFVIIKVSPALSTPIVVGPRPGPKRLAALVLYLDAAEGQAQESQRIEVDIALGSRIDQDVVRPTPA